MVKALPNWNEIPEGPGPKAFHGDALYLILIVPYSYPRQAGKFDWEELQNYWNFQIAYWRARLEPGVVEETPKGFVVKGQKYFELGQQDAWMWWWTALFPWIGGYVHPWVLDAYGDCVMITDLRESNSWKLPSHPEWGLWEGRGVVRPKPWLQ